MKKLSQLACCLPLLFFPIITQAYLAKQLIVEPTQGVWPIEKALLHAKHSIDLVMYGFTDRTLRHALLKAAHHGVQVRVILEDHPYLSQTENRYTTLILKHHGIPVHTGNPAVALTHQKTLIIDHQRAWVMTGNFTYSAFHRQRNFAVLLTNPKAVHEIEQQFKWDWNHAHHPHAKVNLVWSPLNARKRLTTLIKKAKHSIDIYALELSDYQMIGALAQAAKHGINVTVILSKQSAHLIQHKILYLRKRGVTVVIKPQIHAKVILCDPGLPGQEAYVGSTNLTESSLDHNRELGVVITNPELIYKIAKTFQQDLA